MRQRGPYQQIRQEPADSADALPAIGTEGPGASLEVDEAEPLRRHQPPGHGAPSTRQLVDWAGEVAHHPALGRLTAGVAHDFNNLLAVITASAELLERELEGNDSVKEPLRDIQEASLRGAELVRHLMAFGRQQVLEPMVIDLSRHIAQMCGELSQELGPRAELRCRIEDEAACVRVDPRQLRKVLRALVLNAAEAMPEGGSITLDVESVDLCGLDPRCPAPTPCVMVAVSDTGTGMEESTRLRAFEPFYTTKSRASGRGLGLSTAYGIVKQSGGAIWLDSAPGEGTTVAVYFPRVTTAAVGAETIHPESLGPGSVATPTILLVDDETVVRRAIGRLLAREGYAILEAGSPAEALELARRHGPGISLVLSDVVMPLMTGFELVERLRDIVPHAKALLMSGHAADAVDRELEGEAKIPFVQKPISGRELAAAVRAVLCGRSQFPEHGSDPAEVEVA